MQKMGENILKDKSYKFALRIVKLYKHLIEDKLDKFIKRQRIYYPKTG